MGRALHFTPTEDDIHAFVDGELDPIHAAAVAASVYADPEKAARVASYRAQREGLRALYEEIVREPLPESMRALIEAVCPRQRRAAG